MKNHDLVVNKFIWGFLILGMLIIPSCSVFTKPDCIGWEFDNNGNSEGWHNNQGINLETLNGNLMGNVTQPDGFWVGPDNVNIDATVYTKLEVKYRINSLEASDITFFYWTKTGDSQFEDDKRIKFDVQTENTWKIAMVDLAQSVNWNGNVSGIGLYPTWYSNTLVEYDYIRLCI